MSDLLKEAIADAKAVRETALENARIALEEAFTPRIQSMLSAKLKETDEVDEYGRVYREEEDEEEEFPGEGEFDLDEPGEEVGEIPAGIPGEEDEFGGDEFGGGDMEAGIEGDGGTVEIGGQVFKLVPIEDAGMEYGDQDEGVFESNEDNLDKLDLESIIKELEEELGDGEDLEESDNPYDGNEQHNQYKNAPKGTTASVKKEKFDEGEDESDEDTVDEVEDPTKIGYDPTGAKKRSADESSIGSLKTENQDDEIIEINLDEEDDDELDEELKSSGIGKGENHDSEQFSADTEDPEGQGFHKKPFKEQFASVKSELKEYKEAVKFLRDKLHEVNILNAKLLFTNKLFREYALSNDQKVRVVETFDRAQTVREIKIVYSTIAESYGTRVSKKTMKESVIGSSKSVSSTKPTGKKVITEEAKNADRFRKLAGLI
jgi:hypothetical protein